MVILGLIVAAHAFDFDDDEIVSDAPPGAADFGGEEPAAGVSVAVTHMLGAAAPACLFAIDLSDVAVLRPPPCEALERGKIYVGLEAMVSDGGRRSFSWLRERAGRSLLSNTSSARFRNFLDGGTDSVIFNCGVVGGRAAAVLPMLARVFRRFVAHYTSKPRPPSPGSSRPS